MPVKRTAITLAAMAVIIAAACLISNAPGGEAERISFPGRITVTGLTENSGTDKLTFDIQAPAISGLGDKRFEEDLNNKIKTQVETARRKAEQAADEFWQQAKEDNYEPWPYVFYADYEVKSAGAMLSLRVTTFLCTGGTGMPQTMYYNVDIEKNKLLNLNDLFRNEDYVQIINSVIVNEMAKDIERYLPPGEFPGVSRNTKFFIKEGKLYIAFAKYEVASGMTGEPEFLIPAEKISKILNKEYKDIFKKGN